MSLGAAAPERAHLSPKPMRCATAECRVGVAKKDITPPVGVYNRCWGAAASDVATGVHKPLFVSAMAFAPITDAVTPCPDTPAVAAKTSAEKQPKGTTLLLVTIDLGWLQPGPTKILHESVVSATGLPADNVLVQLSHTHASVSLGVPFINSGCPGGAIALRWFDKLKAAVGSVGQQAIARLEHSWVTAALGSCDLAQKRDLWDKAAGGYVTAFDPSTYGKADKTVVALRVVTASGARAGSTTATVCNYGCHPTSLGHTSSLISPDWPGSAREQVEALCGGTCVFVLGACGDTMPARGHQADTRVTERDGQRVGLAAAAAIRGMQPPGTQLRYSGPIVSGAVIGAWTPEPLNPSARARTRLVRHCKLMVRVPVRALDTVAAAKENLERATMRLQSLLSAKPATDTATANTTADTTTTTKHTTTTTTKHTTSHRDARALVEQAQRHLLKIEAFASARDESIDGEGTMALWLWVWQLGDIFVVAMSGEPYSSLQSHIRSRVPMVRVVVAPMTNGTHPPGYMLPSCSVGCGCYQDKIAVMGAGALELMATAAAAKITQWCFDVPGDHAKLM